jgi:hypothetical protein
MGGGKAGVRFAAHCPYLEKRGRQNTGYQAEKERQKMVRTQQQTDHAEGTRMQKCAKIVQEDQKRIGKQNGHQRDLFGDQMLHQTFPHDSRQQVQLAWSEMLWGPL